MEDFEVTFRVHAIEQMFRRSITEVEVRAVLEDGDAIEVYEADLPFPSKLLLGWVGERGERRAMHVVASFDEASRRIFVVTVYYPDPALWEPGFRTRKPL